MENALFPGDYILVSKLKYGPKLPQSASEIPWINLFERYRTIVSSSRECWRYNRLPGFSKVSRGDIIVFKEVHEDKQFIVKRCVGLPGEHIEIVDGNVFVEGKLDNEIPTVKRLYKIWAKKNTKSKFSDRTPLSTVLNLTILQKEELIELRRIDSMNYVTLTGKAFAKPEGLGWTLDKLGGLLIPKKGLRINLTIDNYRIYRYIINRFEKATIRERNGIIYIDSHPATSYTFKYNYYFMMGDNRNFSKDSRYWGFLPEEKIVGVQLWRVIKMPSE